MVFLSAVFVTTIICLAYLWYKNDNSDYWKKRNLPYVKKTTPLGVTIDIIRKNISMTEIYKNIYDKFQNEPNVGIFLVSQPALLLRDPENIAAVLAGDFQSFSSRGIPMNPNDLLADNVLFINEYRRWKLLRQKLSPVFSTAKLKNMFYILERCAKDFVDFVDVVDKSAEKFDILYTYSTASIGAAIFGIDTKTKNTMDSPFLEMSKTAVSTTLSSNLVFFLGNLWPAIVELLNIKTFGAYESFFIGVIRNVLSSRRTDKQKRHDFIDICIELQNNGIMRDSQTGYEIEPTDEIMAAQAFFFFVAGADTSANTMHFTLLELSNNSEILKKVHNEIDRVFEKSGDTLSYDDIGNLQYLEMVVNEAMRKFPPIGLMQRKCVKETILPVGNVRIEKDVVVVIPIFALHRDNRFYPEPEKFDPERFSSENLPKISKFTYMPFGEGNRICIGARFARLQVLAGLAWLLRRYTLVHQNCQPTVFEPSFFSLRAPQVNFDLKLRNI